MSYRNTGIGALGESKNEMLLRVSAAERKVNAAQAAVARNQQAAAQIGAVERTATLRDRMKLARREIEDSTGWASWYADDITELNAIGDEADRIVSEISAIALVGPPAPGIDDSGLPSLGDEPGAPPSDEIPWVAIAAVVGVGIILTVVARRLQK